MRRAMVAAVLGIAGGVGMACGGSGGQDGFAVEDGGAGAGGDASGGSDHEAPGTFGDGGMHFGEGGTAVPEDGGGGTPVALIYAHSATTLYRLDATTKQVAVVGTFSGGCDSVIDIAIDSNSNGYVTTSNALWKVDLGSAACTKISSGTYPNSLSFVPAGTLDPNVEALVGYQTAAYIRIDTSTGAVTNIGKLSGGYSSSGDIVSVIGGGTFLTVKGGSANCGDCLLQIDPKTGDLVQSYGSVGHSDVFGLAFWAGTAYGFDNGGQMFSMSWQNGKLATAAITVPNPPPSLEFWGAGSTTSAPPTADDGGGIPVAQ